MKRIVEDADAQGMEAFLGEKIFLLCANYFYAGKLVGVNESFVELEEAAIVYETGDWAASTYADSQRLPGKTWRVQLGAVESYGMGK